MSDPVLEVSGASLALKGSAGLTQILHGISLNVKRGETLALVGPSGSGKSSLLMLLGGLERATSGTVKALGQDLGALGEDALARFRSAHMSIVFQSFHLIPTLTALENVALPLELAQGGTDAFEKARTALASVGLEARAGHYPSQLSGGEQQRVALARALITRPDILLADEPTGNLDGATGNAVADLIFELCAEHGTTLVLVTHDTALAARCQRAVALSDGRLEAEPEGTA